MIGNSQEKFDDQGNLTDDVTRTLITRLLQRLVQKARAHRRSRSGPRPSPLARGDKHRA